MKYVFKRKEIKVIKPDKCKLNLTAFSGNQVCFAGKTIRAYIWNCIRFFQSNSLFGLALLFFSNPVE